MRGCRRRKSQRQRQQSFRVMLMDAHSPVPRPLHYGYTRLGAMRKKSHRSHKSQWQAKLPFLVLLLDATFLAPVQVHYRCIEYDVTRAKLPTANKHSEMMLQLVPQMSVAQRRDKRNVTENITSATLLDVPGVQCGHIQHWPSKKTEHHEQPASTTEAPLQRNTGRVHTTKRCPTETPMTSSHTEATEQTVTSTLRKVHELRR